MKICNPSYPLYIGKEKAPDPKRTKYNSIANIRNWDDTYFRYGFIFPDDQMLNVAAAKFQKCKNKRVIKFLAFYIL